jgi:L-2-hydroxyglutarate oxidase LhgO
MGQRRVVVVGGGILGLAFARELLRREPGTGVVVVEKEPELAAHQTGRNSGVVHSGVYYQPGSLKARLCRRGVELLERYCAENQLPHRVVGKVIVALDDDERTRLHRLHDQARANGIQDARLITRRELAEVEPECVGVEALHLPTVGIVDFRAIACALGQEIVALGGEIHTETPVLAIDATATGLGNGRARVTTGSPALPEIDCDQVVVCAGQQADVLARSTGAPASPWIVPFMGKYWELRPARRGLVRGLIYPVPDPRYPFLGIHFTPRVNEGVLVGPNAILAVGREAYRLRESHPIQLARIIASRPFIRLARQHWSTGARELWLTASKRAFLSAGRRYVPALRDDDVVPARPGIRAQAVDERGALVDDFVINGSVINGGATVVHVRNAPSPAATSSLAIAEELYKRLRG